MARFTHSWRSIPVRGGEVGDGTAVRADGVNVQELHEVIQIGGREGESQAFVRDVRLKVPGGDRFAAVLSGFDICSAKDADKLASFHLAVTELRRDEKTGEVVFQIVGAFNVDCDSAECDLYDSTGAMIFAMIAGAAAGAKYGPWGAIAGGVFGALFSKLDIATEYVLGLEWLDEATEDVFSHRDAGTASVLVGVEPLAVRRGGR